MGALTPPLAALAAQVPFGPKAGQKIFQPMLYADTSGEVITFKYRPAGGGADVPLMQTVTFVTDGSAGDAVSPFELTPSEKRVKHKRIKHKRG